ncbi:MAG: hypothetical protein A2Z83_00165 [Omnitrophica bacterium GWA2_52_8]|nr:MAG: hypothetical protein A2Z83_00165 [Omnitrophica bacterium GWA2_52_8]
MSSLFIYLLMFGIILYAVSYSAQRRGVQGPVDEDDPVKKPASRWFKAKRHPREVWIQVYETESREEAQMMQARLQEQEIECVIYEKGKKDIHGNMMNGLGVAVPKPMARQAQGVISRMPV